MCSTKNIGTVDHLPTRVDLVRAYPICLLICLLALGSYCVTQTIIFAVILMIPSLFLVGYGNWCFRNDIRARPLSTAMKFITWALFALFYSKTIWMFLLSPLELLLYYSAAAAYALAAWSITEALKQASSRRAGNVHVELAWFLIFLTVSHAPMTILGCLLYNSGIMLDFMILHAVLSYMVLNMSRVVSAFKKKELLEVKSASYADNNIKNVFTSLLPSLAVLLYLLHKHGTVALVSHPTAIGFYIPLVFCTLGTLVFTLLNEVYFSKKRIMKAGSSFLFLGLLYACGQTFLQSRYQTMLAQRFAEMFMLSLGIATVMTVYWLLKWIADTLLREKSSIRGIGQLMSLFLTFTITATILHSIRFTCSVCAVGINWLTLLSMAVAYLMQVLLVDDKTLDLPESVKFKRSAVLN